MYLCRNRAWCSIERPIVLILEALSKHRVHSNSPDRMNVSYGSSSHGAMLWLPEATGCFNWSLKWFKHELVLSPLQFFASSVLCRYVGDAAWRQFHYIFYYFVEVLGFDWRRIIEYVRTTKHSLRTLVWETFSTFKRQLQYNQTVSLILENTDGMTGTWR